MILINKLLKTATLVGLLALASPSEQMIHAKANDSTSHQNRIKNPYVVNMKSKVHYLGNGFVKSTFYLTATLNEEQKLDTLIESFKDTIHIYLIPWHLGDMNLDSIITSKDVLSQNKNINDPNRLTSADTIHYSTQLTYIILR